jgi:putative endonuclease
MMDRSGRGALAETAAARYLEHQGYRILQKNYRSRWGEIDLIAEDCDCLVFIEVRSRRGAGFGLPQETVNWAKQQKVRQMAVRYLKEKGLWQKNCRFDVIGVLFDHNDNIKALELIRDAF